MIFPKTMNYSKLFSSHLPNFVRMPEELQAQTKYVFSVTNTDPSTLPYQGYINALSKSLSDEGTSLASYPLPQGHERLRKLITHDLRKTRGFDTTSESVFLSEGASGAIKCILDAFIDPGNIVLVEEFTYLGTLRMLLEREAQVIHIPTDDRGMNTDILESTISQLVSKNKHPKMIITIPIYQNPMGMTLSIKRRNHMLEISNWYGIPILENESYADFYIDGEELPQSIAGIDNGNSVMYVSSYTKLLGCGLRLGYGIVPGPVAKMLSNLKFGGYASHLASMVIYQYMRDHKDEHVHEVRLSLKAKRDAMLTALQKYFPSTCTWNSPHGGMMIWVQLPKKADTFAALDKAVKANVKYSPGSLFRAKRDRKNYLRLAYSHNTPEEIDDGINILADVFAREGLFNN